MTILFSIIAIILYLSLGFFIGKRLFSKERPLQQDTSAQKRLIINIGVAAVIFHGIVLYHKIFLQSGLGLNFGIFNAASLVMWFVALLLILTTMTKPVENLGILIFPIAGLALLIEQIFPSSHVILSNEAKELRFHILLSILAYSLFSIAAVQAILLAIQNKYLRNKHPGGFVRALPPLETMESLLFQMIGVGFILHSAAMLTGAIFLKDIFAQHLVHKTVLSVVAWIVFAILLWGRWRFGWRGRTAIRWTLSGFVILLLAYFGSKMVLEIVLGR
jgi:ABC-type uncharacterized transport system permease subunit